MIYSLLSIIIFGCFFYFYQGAEIFTVKITEISAVYEIDICLKAFFDHTLLPEAVSQPRLVSVSPTFQGAFLAIICLIGFPIILGYRVALLHKSNSKETSK